MADNDSSEGKAPPKTAYRTPELKVTPKPLTPTVVKPSLPAYAAPVTPKVAPDAFAAELEAAKAEVRSTMSTLLASLIRRVGKLLHVGLGRILAGGKRKPRT